MYVKQTVPRVKEESDGNARQKEKRRRRNLQTKYIAIFLGCSSSLSLSPPHFSFILVGALFHILLLLLIARPILLLFILSPSECRSLQYHTSKRIPLTFLFSSTLDSGSFKAACPACGFFDFLLIYQLLSVIRRREFLIQSTTHSLSIFSFLPSR